MPCPPLQRIFPIQGSTLGLLHCRQILYHLSQQHKPQLHALSLSHVRLFATPWTAAHQAPLSMGILQARILEWIVMPSSRGSSQPRNQTCVSDVSCTGRQVGSLPLAPPGKVLYHYCHLGRKKKGRKTSPFPQFHSPTGLRKLQ